ncbi:hypothetical protein WN944_014458 [Citrus x changshan-huyou]|uniref:Uncharacterized protein n=1 Tax=Citrus x changshan-huyou TaxID=2935761 RepID=A0AAP0MAM3_9ROSI
MAKKLRTKHNPPGPKREPSTMKIFASEHFIRHIKNLSKFGNVMEAIKTKLTRRQLRLFKNDAFGHFVKMDTYVFNGVIMHNALLRQVAYDECDEHQLAYDINGNTKLGANHRLNDLYFDNDIGANLKELYENFENLNFNDMDDFDALKIAFQGNTLKEVKYNFYGFRPGHHPNIKVPPNEKDKEKPTINDEYEIDDSYERQSQKFFRILLRKESMGWLEDEFMDNILAGDDIEEKEGSKAGYFYGFYEF